MRYNLLSGMVVKRACDSQEVCVVDCPEVQLLAFFCTPKVAFIGIMWIGLHTDGFWPHRPLRLSYKDRGNLIH